ncbi:MAG: hypothetical protein ACPG8W_14360 [Candidatus Promineifilaceae bacterium]
MTTPNYTQLIENGLNLIAVLDTQTLPDTIQTAIPHDLRQRFGRLMLIGNGGGEKLWPALQQYGMKTPDPIDNFSINMARQFIHDQLDGADHHILYPLTDSLVSLQQLGSLAGWHHPSPLGLGIHSHYGVWFAYRVALLIDADMPLRVEQPTPSPCDSCLDKPCMTSCPINAVRGIDQFQVGRCGKHRVAENSSCADRCLSRLACPVGTTHRYPLAQIQYHYANALPAMRAWYEKEQ